MLVVLLYRLETFTIYLHELIHSSEMEIMSDCTTRAAATSSAATVDGVRVQVNDVFSSKSSRV